MITDQEKKLIAKIGTGSYKDGSSINPGTTYSPIPFQGYENVPKHKSDAVVDDFKYVLELADKVKAERILEIGCANGYYTFNLANDKNREIMAFEGDINPFELNVALKEKFKIDNVHFLNDYMDENILEAAIADFKPDTVIMTNVHMWIHKQIGEARTIALMKKISDAGANLIFQTAHAESNGMYSVKSLPTTEAIEAYLELCGFGTVVCVNKSTMHGGIRSMFLGVCSDNGKEKSDPNQGHTSTVTYDDELSVAFKTLTNWDHPGVHHREWGSLSRLSNSPHFPKPLAFREKEGSSVITMTYCGVRLTKDNLPKDWRKQVLDILDILDASDIQHNDINPRNLMVLEGTIYLIDFGWSTLKNQDSAFLKQIEGLGWLTKHPDKFDDRYSMHVSMSYITGQPLF